MSYPRRSLEMRFWRFVDRGDELGCWLWRGQRRPDGMRYGVMSVRGADDRVRREYAHRVAFFLSRGRWPAPGKVVMHGCDNPPCVNPAHLREGEHADNVRDAQRKGRLATGERNAMARAECRAKVTGERNPAARLASADVMEIRRLVAEGGALGDIANRFGVAKSTVCLIANRKRWRHVA